MNKKKKSKKFAHAMAWLLVSAGLLATGWYAHSVFGMGKKITGRAVSADPYVAVEKIQLVKFNPPEEFVGHVEPIQEVDILPQIDGYIKKVCFEEGAEVKVGDLLFTIDDERYVADNAVAKAELEQAKSRVVQMEAALDRAERYLKRLKSADERGITQTEMDQAETQLLADKAALGSAKAAVSQAQAKLDRSAYDLRHTKIYSPITGRIGKALRHAGDYVSPSKDSLARVVQLDPMRVTFPITDRAWLDWAKNAELLNSTVGDTRRLRLRLADESIYPLTGSWLFSDNEMNAATATLIVRAQFANPKRSLLPNAYVTVLADEANPQPVMVVPALSITRAGSESGVWVLGDDNRVKFTPVKTGIRFAGKVRIISGVNPGQTIVVQGVHKLGADMRVRVVPASEFH